jgi:hypothetical protein
MNKTTTRTLPTKVQVRSRTSAHSTQLVFLTTTFVSAFLLFQVQPLIGKIILPWFGGTAAVWTVCLMFFQAVLFAGYTYAHLSTTRLGGKSQFALHSLLILAAVAMLPIIPSDFWKPTDSRTPTADVLKVLSVSVGLPFLLLSTTAPLVQHWWSMVHEASPYRLYALSNIGSLLALLSYSFVVEPLLGTVAQAYTWSGLFTGLGVLLLVCQFAVWTARRDEPGWNWRWSWLPGMSAGETRDDDKVAAERPAMRQYLSWLMFAAMGTTALMAVTNILCQDVSSVPFLWIGPLTVYLLSFILCFGQSSWYRRSWCIPLMLISSFGCARTYDGFHAMSLYAMILVNLIALFFACVFFHGELERMKPSARYLTSFYLFLSAGGMLGGLFVGVIAPLLFLEYYEFPIVVIGSWLVAMVLLIRDKASPLRRVPSNWIGLRALLIWMGLWALLLTGFGGQIYLWSEAIIGRHNAVLLITRNFYGVLKVVLKQSDASKTPYYALVSGTIEHGGQFLDEPDAKKRITPTSYYGHGTGIGRAFDLIEKRPSRRIGAIGLGTGTIAAYAREKDYFRFYEINPSVLPWAEQLYTFTRHVGQVGATGEIVLGDARLKLEAEPDQQFDLLIVDAFSGDSVPIHLLTREATEVYLRHVRPDGVLAIHISNRYLDLARVTRDLAIHHGLNFAHIEVGDNNEVEQDSCDWILMAPPGKLEPVAGVKFVGPHEIRGPVTTWTDDRSSLFEVVTSGF